MLIGSGIRSNVQPARPHRLRLPWADGGAGAGARSSLWTKSAQCWKVRFVWGLSALTVKQGAPPNIMSGSMTSYTL